MDDGVEGWAGYKVADRDTHQLDGGGVTVFNRNNPSIHTENGFEVPETPGVHLPRCDRQPQRRHDRPRGQRRGRPGERNGDRRPCLRSRLSVISRTGGGESGRVVHAQRDAISNDRRDRRRFPPSRNP